MYKTKVRDHIFHKPTVGGKRFEYFWVWVIGGFGYPHAPRAPRAFAKNGPKLPNISQKRRKTAQNGRISEKMIKTPPAFEM